MPLLLSLFFTHLYHEYCGPGEYMRIRLRASLTRHMPPAECTWDSVRNDEGERFHDMSTMPENPSECGKSSTAKSEKQESIGMQHNAPVDSRTHAVARNLGA